MEKNGAPVAQLDRASAYEAEGRRFESSRARHFYWLLCVVICRVTPSFTFLLPMAIRNTRPKSQIPRPRFALCWKPPEEAMTVGELLHRLSKFNPEAEVQVYLPDHGQKATNSLTPQERKPLTAMRSCSILMTRFF
jgi:hypothetical protein